ncbi:hypothetical protein OESDEN_09266 [Oesophagostomum dentatum]|uniref:Uncharacterized protein n=1 Tax=Oesophagostomum dentatum TaxID=61180 RepID=A0A0B1T007_OESDE|nr:hypothetical protein OESDEN_09266 [Oesophagostomum dentatum]
MNFLRIYTFIICVLLVFFVADVAEAKRRRFRKLKKGFKKLKPLGKAALKHIATGFLSKKLGPVASRAMEKKL